MRCLVSRGVFDPQQPYTGPGEGLDRNTPYKPQNFWVKYCWRSFLKILKMGGRCLSSINCAPGILGWGGTVDHPLLSSPPSVSGPWGETECGTDTDGGSASALFSKVICKGGT